MEQLAGASLLYRGAQDRHQQFRHMQASISWLSLLQAFHKHLPLERMATKKPLKWHLVRVICACQPAF